MMEGRRLKKTVALLLFLGLASGLLYVHLIAWPQSYAVGEVVPYAIFAPAAFEFEDASLIESLRESGDFKVVDRSVKPQVLQSFENFRREFMQLRADVAAAVSAVHGEAASITDKDLEPFAQRIKAVAERYKIEQPALEFYLQLAESDLDAFFGQIRSELEQQLDGVVSRESIAQLRKDNLQNIYAKPVLLYPYFLEPNVLDWKPPEITAEQRRAATVEIAEGSLIARRGDVLTPRMSQQIEALREPFMKHQWRRFYGALMLLLVLMVLWYKHVRRFAQRILDRASTIGQLCGLWLVFLFLGIVIGRLPFENTYYAVSFAVAALAIVVVLLYDSRFALYFALGLALMLATVLNFGYGLMLYTLIAALLPPVLLYPGCHRRIQVSFALKQGALNAVVAGVVLYTQLEELSWQVVLIAATSGIGAAVIALGLLPVIESITAHLTPGKLTDLLNPENAILKRLKREAHGTYVHSMFVADLTEEACKDIGAEWLIAKVGALYHDIGKLKRPGFFAENIHDLSRNPHQGLPPETSAKIITDHVKDGLHMARDAGLPLDLLPYIAEHHGNYVIRYFYHKALKLHEEDPEKHPAPEIDDFRYEGPLPHSRETGVLMLADVTEAIVRAGSAATVEELHKIVDDVVEEKLEEQQLVASGLTIGDLLKIKQAFVRILSAQRHARVVYPETQGDVDFHHGKPRPAEIRDAAKAPGG
jgi:putative nucleotidyltransferase with HDIG domain